MPEQLDADVVLSIDDALQQVETLRSTLEEALSTVGDTLTTSITDAIAGLPGAEVSVDADASAIPGEIESAAAGAGIEVPVDVDLSAIEPAFDSVVGGLDPPAIPIEADTSQAEAALDDLASQAEETGGALGDGGFGGGAKTAAAGADLAQGSTAGLAGALGEVSPKAAGAAAGVAAGAAAIGAMFSEAVQAEGATQRFDSALGGMSDRVENVDIGGLNTNLTDLALTLGSDDDALRQALASFFQLGEASGAAAPEVAATTEELAALSARAVALNPSLGGVDEVAGRMAQALTRGGRFAARFGIDLSAAEISARALRDTGKETSAELTFYEKAAAGAALATEKYGAGLDDIVANGAANSEVRLRRLKQTVIENVEALGMPLVAPIFDLMEEGIPVSEQLGRGLSALGKSAIPVVTAAAEGLVPILTLTADVLEMIPPPLLSSVGGTLLMARATRTASAGTRAWLLPLTALLPLLNAIDPALGSGVVSAASFAFVGNKLGAMLPRVGAGMGTVAGATFGLGQQMGGTTGLMLQGASAGAMLGTAIGGPGLGTAIGAGVGALGGLGASLLGVGKDAGEAHDEIVKLSGELEKLGANKAAQRFIDSEIDGFSMLSGHLEDFKEDFRELAATSPAAAQRVAEGLRNMAEQGDPIAKAALAGTDLNRMLDKGAGSYAKSSAAKREADIVNQGLAGSEQSLVEAQAAANEALESFVTTAVGRLPAASGVLDSTKGALDRFGIGLDNAVSPEAFNNDLQASINAITNFQSTVQTLIERGLTGVAQLVIEKGPEIGGAFGQAVLAGDPAIAQSMETNLGTLQSKAGEFDAFLRGPFTGSTVSAWSGMFGMLPPTTASLLSETGATIAGAAPDIASAAGTAASGAAGQFGAGVAPIPGLAGTAVGSAGGTITAGASGLANPAYVAGAQVGAQFGDGIIGGLASRTGLIYGKVREVVRGMVDAANTAGSPTEHLWADSARSWVGAAVTAIDVEAASLQAASRRAARAAAPVGGPGDVSAGGAPMRAMMQAVAALGGGPAGGTTVVVLRDRHDLKGYLPDDVDIDDPVFGDPR